MAAQFIVETGLIVANANAFVSVATFKQYHDDRGNNYSAYSDAAIQTAIVRGTAWMEQKYGARWVGQRQTATQSLSWPREFAEQRDGYEIDSASVPKDVQDACCECSFAALSQDLNPVVTAAQQGTLQSTSVTVGPITTSKTFSGAGKAPGMVSIPRVDGILQKNGLVSGSNEVTRA